MEQVLMVFAIAVLVWLGTSASRKANAPELRNPRGAKSNAGDHGQ